MLPRFIWCSPQSTEEEAGSGTRGCRRREVRPAPRGQLEHPDCSASALLLQFLHSLEELQRKSKPRVSIQGNYSPHHRNRIWIMTLRSKPTFRPLRQTHAQPAHAALAADTGGTGAEWVERDGSDDQGQVQGQVYGPRDVNVYLSTDMRKRL